MPKDADPLDTYLTGDSDVSRVYHQSDERPAPALDDTILRVARHRVASKPLTKGPFSGSRLVSGALAASVVVTASIALLWYIGETEQTTITAPVEMNAPQSPAPDVPRKEVLGKLPADPADRPREESAPIPAEAVLEEVPDAEPLQIETRQTVVETKSQPESAALEDAGSTPPAATTENALAPKQEPQSDQEASSGESDFAEAARSARPAQSQSILRRSDVGLESDPHAWLAEVERLATEGKMQAARERLQALQERHPDFSIPPELLARLQIQPGQ